MSDADDAAAIAGAMRNRNLTRSLQMLSGIIAGIVADGQLQDMEIQFLSTWLSDNEEVCKYWPGSAVVRHLREILADGVITEEERSHFLQTLLNLVGSDFSETGSASAEVAALPFDHGVPINLRDARICLTGEFLYGTRPACEAVSMKAGAIPMPNVSKKVSYLIVGTHVSPNWVSTSYGRKIMGALDLRGRGHTISIVPEKSWVEILS
jgi:NAD-dependent DNA ligase